jgi:hypothetical protein
MDVESKCGRLTVAIMWAARTAIGMSIGFAAAWGIGSLGTGRKQAQPAVTPAGKPMTLTPMEVLTIEDMRNNQTEQIRLRRHHDGSWSARSDQKTPASRTFGEDGIVIEDAE